MIDSHIHIDSRPLDELVLMRMAGITAVVSQVYYPHVNTTIDAKTMFDFYDRIIHWEPYRTKLELIETYAGVGLNMRNIPTDWEKVIEALPNYLQEERVVCIGEVGLEPASTTGDLALQEEIVRLELEIAKTHDMPVVFHSPIPEKAKWVEKFGSIIQKSGMNPDKVVIDHASPEVLDLIWDLGCYAGISMQPWRNVNAVDTAKVVARGKNLDRVMINSDSSPNKNSDGLIVPRAVHEMRKMSVPEEDIQKVVWLNPVRFYRLPLR